ncbi:: zf-HC2 [Gemmataceae bacterium]|nr:: zf-HC2 [Gemmataceae bacterium]VTT99552.1 : zf-HC2 [Gemmataceae bacterium]
MISAAHSDAHPAGWEPAPADAVARLGHQLRRKSSRRAFLRTATAVASVGAAGGGLWLLWSRDSSRECDYGGIVCSEVVKRGSDYVAGKVPEPTRSQIAEHVAKCPRCGPLFKRMEDEMSGAG